MQTYNVTMLAPEGLTVATVEMPGFQTAAVACFVNAGTRNEPIDKNGIAHFLEHMAFKGTSQRSALDIAREIELMGADINAFTSHEMTAYYVVGLREHVPQAMAILGDVLTDSVFNQRDIETERGVILQEIKMGQDSPQSLAFDAFGQIAYPNHPAGRPILGTAPVVEGMTRDDFVNFVGDHYQARNMLIAVAGDLRHAQVMEWALETFGGLDNQPVPAVSTPAYVGGVALNSTSRFEQASIVLGYGAPGTREKDAIVYEMLGAALGGGMSSPLFQEVREKRGLVYSVHSFYHGAYDHANLMVYAGTTPENVGECLRLSRAELEKIALAGPTAEDFERARNGLLVAQASRVEKPFSLIRKLAHDWFAHGRSLHESARAKIEAVTPQDIQQAAINALQSAPALSLVGPVDPAVDYTDFLR